MKTTNKLFGFFFAGLVAIIPFSGIAQEYDDMYFNQKDRQKEEKERKALRDSIRKAEEALISKDVNPDYMDRLNEYDQSETDEGYFDENYVDENFDDGQTVNIYNNYYDRMGNSYGDFYDIYWSDPAFYRYTIYDPFYRNRFRANRWAYNPYDYYYGGVRVSMGWTWGWGYNNYYNPYRYNGWYSYDPFCYSPWGYSSYGNNWNRGGWGWNRGGWGNRGYYGSSYTQVVINNFDNNNGIRRGRRVSRSSSYGRLANNSNGVNTGTMGRRPSGGRVDKNTPIQTRRTSSYNRDDSRGNTSGRTVSSRNVNGVQTRGTTSRNTRSSSYNSRTYESRNMSTYTQRSREKNLDRSTSTRPDYSRTVRSGNTSRSNTNVDRSSQTRTAPNVNRNIRSGSYNRSNSSGYNRSNSSGYNRSNSKSYHRSSGSSSNRSGYSNSSRSSGNSYRGYNNRSNSSSRSSGYKSYNNRSSRSSGFSRSSSGSRSSGVSRSSGSSSRSSGNSSRSSSGKSGSSRRGGNK